MKKVIISVLLTCCSLTALGQGLQNHFDVTRLGELTGPGGNTLYICTYLPPGFESAAGNQIPGRQTAGGPAQGDEGFDVANYGYLSLAPDCSSVLVTLRDLDGDPLPSE